MFEVQTHVIQGMRMLSIITTLPALTTPYFSVVTSDLVDETEDK